MEKNESPDQQYEEDNVLQGCQRLTLLLVESAASP